jgi:hypothetical protein
VDYGVYYFANINQITSSKSRTLSAQLSPEPFALDAPICNDSLSLGDCLLMSARASLMATMMFAAMTTVIG